MAGVIVICKKADGMAVLNNMMAENNETVHYDGNLIPDASKQASSGLEGTTITSRKGSIHCMTIIGQIEGHMVLPPQNKTTKYEHVIPQLVAIEENDTIEGLLLILNTVGGDVEAGLAIAEMIASMSKPSVSLILGGGHSIGVPMAVSTDYSFIAPSATMTIHPIRLNGMIIGVPQAYEYFDKMQERVVQFVSRYSNITRERFRQLMLKTGELANDVGTVLFGEEAVRNGLIDELGGLSNALKKLYGLIDDMREGKLRKKTDLRGGFQS